MRIALLFSLIFTLLFTGCESKKVDGVYTSNEGPYFKFIKGKFFELGVPGDPNPLKGNFTIEEEKLNLLANSIMLGSYATTNFICHIKEDTLLIDVLYITHPKFEIFIDKRQNFARTRRDSITKEFKLNSSEAEEELFIYYKLVHDKFIKKKGE
ncbi:MAG: hypothetical protein ACPL25_03350 [Ignavibacteria bacterium]